MRSDHFNARRVPFGGRSRDTRRVNEARSDLPRPSVSARGPRVIAGTLGMAALLPFASSVLRVSALSPVSTPAEPRDARVAVDAILGASTAADTGASTAARNDALSSPPVDFDREIRPVLAAKCLACHGPDAEAREAGLRLDTFEGATAALRSGKRAIVPGEAGASELLVRASAHDAEDRMPPAGEPLTAAELDAVRRRLRRS